MVLLFQTFNEIRDVFVQILPVFIKVHPIDSRRGSSFELPETPLEKILVQQPIQIAKPVPFVFCCPSRYSRSEVGMVYPAFHIRAMFPLRATQIRRPLPHVVGSPASEYYETI